MKRILTTIVLLAVCLCADARLALRQPTSDGMVLQQQTNAALSEDIEKMDTDEGVKEVARDKLGLVSEGEITFYDIGG